MKMDKTPGAYSIYLLQANYSYIYLYVSIYFKTDRQFSRIGDDIEVGTECPRSLVHVATRYMKMDKTYRAY